MQQARRQKKCLDSQLNFQKCCTSIFGQIDSQKFRVSSASPEFNAMPLSIFDNSKNIFFLKIWQVTLADGLHIFDPVDITIASVHGFDNKDVYLCNRSLKSH